MSVPQLLAKRPYGDRRVTLEAHLQDTQRAAARIFQPGSRMLADYARFFRLKTTERFLVTLQVAALFHDVGKANSDFLDAVLGKRRDQAIRHEHLSALVMFLPDVAHWLRQAAHLDFDVAVAAVLSHHFKADRDGDHRWAQARRSGAIETWLDHPEIAHVLARVATIAQLARAPKITARVWPDDPSWPRAFEEGRRQARTFERAVANDATRRSLLLATKVAVVVADAVASGLVRENASIDDWIDDVVHRDPLVPSDVTVNIIDPRIKQIGSRWRGFDELQTRATTLPSRTLLIAPCGVGKTMAAWKWAEGQLAQQPASSVLFLYPTRGTATEGFRDYVGWAPETESALVHASSRFELDGMLENPPDALKGKAPALSERDARLFALGLWPRRYFSATIDQLLGFLEHQYKSACLVPLLARSLVVVDEVHSFDRKLFDALLDLLRNFDVPVLAMTATLVPSRKRELESAGLEAFPKPDDLDALRKLVEHAERARYVLEQTTFERAFAEAVRQCGQNARVLWVVNTVGRCQALVRKFDAEGLRPLVYHSKFRLEDRRRAHAATVSAFQRADAALAVTTQVCEMSLDLDADVLVTEVAPASSLVQRFGRANRHLSRGPDFRASLIVYEAPNALPYDKEDLDVARAFLGSLPTDVSQSSLANALELTARPETSGAENATRFLSSGYYAVPGALRDDDGAGAPCVLDSDLVRLKEHLDHRTPYDGLVLNAPRKALLAEPQPSWVPRYLGVAPSESYDARLGFLVEGH